MREEIKVRKARDTTIDTISGLMVTWMVIYHVFIRAHITDHVIYKYLLQWLFFFIPWFYFKSGFFGHTHTNSPFLRYTKENFKSLIIPMFFWIFVGIITSLPKIIFIDKYQLTIICSSFFHLLKTGDTFGNLPLWFLFSLFFVKALGYFLVRLQRGHTIILLFICLIISTISSSNSLILPAGIHNILPGVIFYYSGYLFKRDYSSKKPDPFTIYSFAFLFIVINKNCHGYIDIHFNSLLYGSYVNTIALSISAIILSYYLLKGKSISPIAWVGKHSFSILVVHWPVMTIVETICQATNIPTAGSTYASILFCTTLPATFTISSLVPLRYITLSSLTQKSHH